MIKLRRVALRAVSSTENQMIETECWVDPKRIALIEPQFEGKGSCVMFEGPCWMDFSEDPQTILQEMNGRA